MNADQRGADERRLAIGATRIIGVLTVPAAVLGYVAAGWPGAISATIGLAFVLVLFAGSAALLSWAAAHQPTGGLGLLILGLLVRLPLYAVSLALLGQVSWIHGSSLALALVSAAVLTLIHELRTIARSPRLYWADPAAARPATAPDATRSQLL